jgi:hypothetical protein
LGDEYAMNRRTLRQFPFYQQGEWRPEPATPLPSTDADPSKNNQTLAERPRFAGSQKL